MRGAHLHLDAQRPSKAQQSRGKIASGWRTHRARIAIQGDALGKSVGLDSLSQRLQQRFGREIGADLTPQQDRSAFINDVERFCHMLLFARWLLGVIHDRADIFEIDLPALQRRCTGQVGLRGTGGTMSNALVALEDLRDGACRGRQEHLTLPEGDLPGREYRIALGPGVRLSPSGGSSRTERMRASMLGSMRWGGCLRARD